MFPVAAVASVIIAHLIPHVAVDPKLMAAYETVSYMSNDRVQIAGIGVAHCPFNAFYFPASKRIVLCDSVLAESEGVVRFIVAHEMAHAWMEQLQLPYTGSAESAADELAAIALIADDHQEAVLEMALYFMGHESPEDPTDDHPSEARRAYAITCLEDGSEDSPEWPECRDVFLRAAHAWARLMHE